MQWKPERRPNLKTISQSFLRHVRALLVPSLFGIFRIQICWHNCFSSSKDWFHVKYEWQEYFLHFHTVLPCFKKEDFSWFYYIYESYKLCKIRIWFCHPNSCTDCQTFHFKTNFWFVKPTILIICQCNYFSQQLWVLKTRDLEWLLPGKYLNL